jgi:sulfatase maturation enzyme AslB (radical SAM superfamily)
MAKFVCDHPWTHFEVNNPNGDVTMCCDNQTALGNVNHGTVAEIWNGEGFQAMRRRMREEGAHALCPHTCPVLNGFKTYQNLDWHKGLAAESPVRRNAELNDREYAAGKTALDSLPRWMRFCYSYLCNLDCYHCYQREEATRNEKLPEAFLDQVREHAGVYQVVYFFGGEPFLYKPVTRMMADLGVDLACRYFLITNATLLRDDVFAMLETKNIGLFAVSLDAGSARSFEALRLRGAKGSWEETLANVGRIAEMRRRKGFVFIVSMTLNSINCGEIETFVDMILGLGGDPIVSLVSNPYQTYAFQKDYLTFSEAQFAWMEAQIGRALTKVEAAGCVEAPAALRHLAEHLRYHRRFDNRPAFFLARQALRRLPEPAKRLIRRRLMPRADT